MELDLLGVVVQVEVWAKEEEALGGWEVTVLELALLASVSALIAELEYPIR